MLRSLPNDLRREGSNLEMQETPGWEPILRNGGGDIDLGDYPLVPSAPRDISYQSSP